MLTFPVSEPKQIDKFDIVNKTSTLILYIQDEVVKPYYVPKNDNGDPVKIWEWWSIRRIRSTLY